MRSIVLAAGMGRRLGHELPKCLTPLDGELTILDLQLAHLRGLSDQICLVVGYRRDELERRHPDCTFVVNEDFATTNTAVSLKLGLEATSPAEDVLWMNADVVCSQEAVARVAGHPRSAMAGKRCAVAEEEVKYVIDATGRILAVSKQLTGALGEAVGINLIRRDDRPLLLAGLGACGAQDYFEKGIEHAIGQGLQIFEADVSDQPCIEIDFPADLAAARTLLPRCLTR